MNADFWHRKWHDNQIGFHIDKPNPLLTKNFTKLGLEPGERVLLPLCGKTLDIHWLIEQGYLVVGIELSELAVSQLFDELGLTPKIEKKGPLTCYSADRLDVYVGDFFDLTREVLGRVDAVYDRAALIALPEKTRAKYCQHLNSITSHVPQLVVLFEYDQSIIDGPPFSVTHDELLEHYQALYDVSILEHHQLEGGMKEVCDAIETVIKLSPR